MSSNESNNYINNNKNLLISIILQVYRYTLFLLSTMTSLFNIKDQTILSSMNIFLTLTITQNINILLYTKGFLGSLYYLLIILSIPLCYKIAQNIIDSRINFLINSLKFKLTSPKERLKKQNISQSIFKHIDYFIKYVYNKNPQSYDRYLTSEESIFLEQEILTQEDRESERIRNKFITKYIEDILENVNRQGDSYIVSNLQISFFIDILQNEAKALTFALRIWNDRSQKVSLQQKQVLYNSIKYIKEQSLLIKSLQSSSDTKFLVNQPKYRFFEQIKFDEDLTECIKMLVDCLNIKKVLIQKIGVNHVELQQLFEISMVFLKKKQKLGNYLLKMVSISKQNYTLQLLIEIFEEAFLHNQPLSKNIQQFNSLNSQSQQFKYQKKEENIFTFSNQSCVLFVSLINTGQIVKTSNNLYSVIPIYKQHEAIGKSIDYMIPKQIAQAHNNLIKNFLDSSDNRQITKSHNLLIGIDKQGWAIPYQVQLQTCLIRLADYGVVAQIKQIKDSSLYLSIDIGKNFNLITCSQTLFDIMFKDFYNKHQLDQIKLDQFMPTLANFVSKKQYENYNYETIFVIPKNKSQAQFENAKQSPQFVELLLQMNVFRISAQCTFIQNKFTQILQLKINELDFIEENHHKIEFLKQSMDHLEHFQVLSQEFVYQQKQILDQKSSTLTKKLQYSLNQNQINEDCRNLISEKTYSGSNNSQSKYISNENIIQNSRQQYQQLDFTSKIQQNGIQEIVKLKEHYQQSYFKIQEENQAQNITHQQIQGDVSSQPEILFSSINVLSTKRDSTKINQQQQYLITPKVLSRVQTLDQNYPFNSIETFDQFTLDNYLSPRNINHFQSNFQFDQFTQKHSNFVGNPRRMSCLSQSNFIKSFKEKMKTCELIMETESHLQAKSGKDKSKEIKNKKIGSLHKFQETNVQTLKSENSYKKKMISIIKRPSSLIGLQLIKYCDAFDNQSNQNGRDFIRDIYSGQIQVYQNYKNLIIQTYLANSTMANFIKKTVQNQHLNFTFTYPLGNQQVSYQSFQYILKILLAFQYKVAYQLDYGLLDEIQILFNYKTVIDQFDQIDQNAMMSIRTNYQDIKQQANIYLTLNIFISVVFSLSFIPIFIYIQRQRQRILALLATFTPEQLQKMLKSACDYQEIIKKEFLRDQDGASSQFSKVQLNLESQKERKNVSVTSSISIQTIQKNKSFSSTTKLNLCSFKICFFAILYLLCNVIYSVTIGVYQTYFLDAIEKNIKFQNQINDIAEYVITIANQRVLMVIVYNGANMLYNSYQKQQQDQYGQLKQKLDSFYNILESQQNNHLNSYFNDNFIENILQKNSCQTIYENQQYLAVKGFNITECNQVKQNIFSSGLISSTKWFLYQFESQYQLYQSNLDDLTFYQNMNEAFSEISLTEQFYFQKYYDYIINALTGYTMKKSYDNYSYFIKLNIIMISIQLVLFVILSQFIYLKFYSKMFNSIQKTKLVLDLIDLNFILENQYIMTYLYKYK
ncbi:hypothetical protein ABPG74_004241 [Tetrahymena malaccensis]